MNLDFSHNTNFAEIGWKYALTMNFNGMTPHLNQLIEVRVIDETTEMEVGRTRLEILPSGTASVMIPGLIRNASYRADFYADLNNNGKYDGTPIDHAWSLSFTNPDGNATLDFTHNTNFTNVDWRYLFRLNLLAMNPHLDQLLELRVVNQSNEEEIGRTSLNPVSAVKSALLVGGFESGTNYRADFYADLNGSGSYDTPPTDHAWRQSFSSDRNVVMNFSHNTNFTDIAWPSLAADDPIVVELIPNSFSLFQNFPNPFNPSTSINFDLSQSATVRLEVFNALGQTVAVLADGALPAGQYTHTFSGNELSSGFYYYSLRAGDAAESRRMLLLK
jgi:hypothetical protein